jgi:hypothetical protein
MKMHIITESGTLYVWDINGHLITRDGDRTNIRASAWDVSCPSRDRIKRPTVGESWEFTGWPGDASRGHFSAWCARGSDTIVTSYVLYVLIEADGVTIDVDKPDVVSIPHRRAIAS